MIEVYAMKYPTEFPLDKFNLFLKKIEKERQAKIQECRSYKIASTFLLGDILIRKIAKEKYNINFEDLKIVRNEYGKPYCTNIKDFYFNISNSGEWVVCAVSDEEVGIDIEKLEKVDYSVADFCFSEEENKYFKSAREEEKLNTFYSLWTLKESYLKNLGKGLSLDLKSFSIMREDKEFKLKVNGEEEDFNFKQFDFDKDYIISLCSKNKYIDDNIKIKHFENIII